MKANTEMASHNKLLATIPKSRFRKIKRSNTTMPQTFFKWNGGQGREERDSFPLLLKKYN